MKPIIFSTAMVQAILEGKKTMTRRIMKPQPDPDSEPSIAPRILGLEDNWDKWFWDTPEGERIHKDCPYGEPCGLLWVREKFLFCQKMDENDYYVYDEQGNYVDMFVYFASEPEFRYFDGEEFTENIPWKPSIHMPKKACRIFLKIKSIKVERVQDITEQDAIAEGVETLGLYPGYDVSAKGKFEGLWYNINGPESWNTNPWVWVIEFETTEKPIK